MRSVIVLSGTIRNDAAFLAFIDQADDILAADGGVRHLRRLSRYPHLLIGDLDSIDASDLAWIRRQNIPIEQYPVRKNETDSELAIKTAIQRNVTGSSQEIILVGAFGSRLDHTWGTQLVAAGLSKPNRIFLLTDGVTRVYTLTGGQSLELDADDLGSGPWVVSTISVANISRGLSYTGLDYPLSKGVLHRSKTLGISNHFSASGRATLSLEQGSVLVIITPET
jgi:thiamine pyrophosphokinase